MTNRLLLSKLLWVVLAATMLLPGSTLADSPKVTALLRERRDVLAKRYELLKMQHEAGEQVSPIQLFEAQDDLRTAELELADTKEKRIEILKLLVANLKRLEEYYEFGTQNAMASKLDVLKAKATRLAAEVELERAIEIK